MARSPVAQSTHDGSAVEVRTNKGSRAIAHINPRSEPHITARLDGPQKPSERPVSKPATIAGSKLWQPRLKHQLGHSEGFL